MRAGAGGPEPQRRSPKLQKHVMEQEKIKDKYGTVEEEEGGGGRGDLSLHGLLTLN